MKYLFCVILFFVTHIANAQVIITPQLMPGSVLQKPQLWNLFLSNSSATSQTLHIEVMLTDVNNGQQVMSGVSKVFQLNTGGYQFSVATLGPIQYNYLSGSYVIDQNPNGFLPYGNFEVCYSVLKHNSDAVEKIAEECDMIEVAPLSPPQLIFPFDQTAIESMLPQFSWIPPSPLNYFTNLRYDLDVVEIVNGQTAADAMQLNVPIVHQVDIPNTFFQYPVSGISLVLDKNYAWQITAKSNGSPISKSEVWSFSTKQFAKLDSLPKLDVLYPKLTKEDVTFYNSCVGRLKFEYLNEAGDSAWNVKLFDFTTKSATPILLDWQGTPLKPGQNLVDLNLANNSRFVDKHVYALELYNLRNETWRMVFEYRIQPNQ